MTTTMCRVCGVSFKYPELYEEHLRGDKSCPEADLKHSANEWWCIRCRRRVTAVRPNIAEAFWLCWAALCDQKVVESTFGPCENTCYREQPYAEAQA